MFKKMISFVAVLGLVLALAPATQAEIVTVPTGLAGGDQYRLVFVSSTSINYSTNDITIYDTVVDDLAQAVPELAALGTTWTCMGSDSDDSARAHTNTVPGTDPDTPIYRLDGSLFASTYAILWSLPNEATGPNITEEGDVTAAGQSYTGSTQAGEISSGKAFGNTNVEYARPGVNNDHWFNKGGAADPSVYPGAIYGISGILVVPEPATFTSIATGLLGLLLFARCRRRRR